MTTTQTRSTVAAVIPTSGRDSVVDAVRSALTQSRPADAVVVATAEENAGRVRDLLGPLVDDVHIELTPLSKPTGGCLRELGTNAVECDWYAFLDDDDEWKVNKLEHQLQFAEAEGLDVASTTLLFCGPDTVGEKVIPERLYTPDSPVADYLFAGRSLRVDRPLLHTSTLVVSRRALQQVNWDPNLALHQDWDLVIRLDDAGFRIGQSEEALTHVATGTTGSMSATNKWLASYHWWNNSRHLMSSKAASDFLYSQVLRYALRERSRAGVAQVMKEARKTTHPSLSAILIAATGLAPRGLFERAMLRDAGASGQAVGASA